MKEGDWKCGQAEERHKQYKDRVEVTVAEGKLTGMGMKRSFKTETLM